MRRTISAALTVALVFGAVLFPLQTAYACECVERSGLGPPYLGVAGAWAAVVGIVRQVEQDAAGGAHGALWIATVDVELSVHRDLGAVTTVSIDTVTDCGIEVRPGDRVGWLLHEGTQERGVGMCSEVGAAVIAATALPEPAATGPPAFLATGPIALAPVVQLDGEGRILGYGSWDEPIPHPLPNNGRQPIAVRLADVCPGGRRVVEHIRHHAWGGGESPRLVGRDVTSGEVEFSITYAQLLGGIHCRGRTRSAQPPASMTATCSRSSSAASPRMSPTGGSCGSQPRASRPSQRARSTRSSSPASAR